jgi:hypothetical protein
MVIKKRVIPHFWGEGRKHMAEEPFGWLFVGSIPLLYEKKKVARQLHVETWLDLTQLVKELGIEKQDKNEQNAHQARGYVV